MPSLGRILAISLASILSFLLLFAQEANALSYSKYQHGLQINWPHGKRLVGAAQSFAYAYIYDVPSYRITFSQKSGDTEGEMPATSVIPKSAQALSEAGTSSADEDIEEIEPADLKRCRTGPCLRTPGGPMPWVPQGLACSSVPIICCPSKGAQIESCAVVVK
jgi:hypothetical protein